MCQLQDQGGQGVCQRGMTRPGQMHMIHCVEHAARGPGVQEMHAFLGGDSLIQGCQLAGLFHRAPAHFRSRVRVLHPVAHRRRSHHKDVGCPCRAPAVRGLGLPHQTAHPLSDGKGADPQIFLGVIGAQHDDQQADGLVTFQAGGQIGQGRHTLVQRVLKNRGAAGEPFFNDQIRISQSPLQQAGPPLFLVEPGEGAVVAVTGVGTITVGVGVSQT